MGKHDSSSINAKDFIIGTLMGGIVGATAALFFAPKSGKELRSDVNHRALVLREKGTEVAGYAKEKSTSLAKSVSEQSGQVADKVKDLSSSVKEDINQWKSTSEESNFPVYEEQGEQQNEQTNSAGNSTEQRSTQDKVFRMEK